jgi:hypothetical protein
MNKNKIMSEEEEKQQDINLITVETDNIYEVYNIINENVNIIHNEINNILSEFLLK